MTLHEASSQRKGISELIQCGNVSICELEKTMNEFPVILISETCEYEQLNELVALIVSEALVRDSSKEEHQEYDSSDFIDVLEHVPFCFKCLKLLLSKLKFSSLSLFHMNGFFLHIFMLCGTHNQSTFPWSNEEAKSSVSEIIQSVLSLTGHESLEKLLSSNIKGTLTLFKSILLSMRPSLMENTWTLNPTTCHIFKWLLSYVQHPDLANYIPDVLPPPLMFISHYSTSLKVHGIQCLHHVINNVPPTELKLYGRADVVYDALFRLVYQKEVEIVIVLYPCLLQFLSGQNTSLHSSRQPRKWNSYDEVFQQLLWNMTMENQIKLRRVYSAQLPTFISSMGITVLKHMKRTKQTLLEYLSVADGPEEVSRINALNSLIALIKVAWPRMEHHCLDFMKSVLILFCDVHNETRTDKNAKETISDLCKKCLLLLKAACPKAYKDNLSPKIAETVPTLQHLFVSLRCVEDC